MKKIYKIPSRSMYNRVSLDRSKLKNRNFDWNNNITQDSETTRLPTFWQEIIFILILG